MESLSKISAMQFSEFKTYFDNNQLEDKLEETEDGLNIFQWALCQMNYDVVKFLMGYGYDLENEMETVVINNMPLNKILPVITLFKQNHGIFSRKIRNANLTDYKNIIELCNKEKIVFDPISKEDLKKANIKNDQKATFVVNPEYVIAMQNNCFEDDVLLNIIEFFAYRNLKEIAIFHETFNKLKTNDSFVLDFKEYSRIFCWLSELPQSQIRNKVIGEITKEFKESSEIHDITEIKKIIFNQLFYGFNTISLNKIINFIDQTDENKNTNEILINKALVSEIISKISVKDDGSNTVLPFSVRHLIRRYCEILDIKPELENHNFITSQLNKLAYREGYLFDKYNLSDFRYEERNCWEENANNVYFDILPDNASFLRLLCEKQDKQKVKDKEVSLFCNSFFYTYLQLAEDIKIDKFCKKYKHVSLNEANHDYNLSDIHEKIRENFYIDFNDTFLYEEAKVIFNSTYGSNYITGKQEFEDKSSRILKYMFKSKLTLSEIEKEIVAISFNKDLSLKSILSDYLIKEQKQNDLSFLYNEANSMEKIELLQHCNIPEPESYAGINLLHNLSINEDEEFKKYILTKNIEITQSDLSDFMRNTEVWSFYEGKAGYLYEFYAYHFGAIDTLNKLLSDADNFRLFKDIENVSQLLTDIDKKSTILRENIDDKSEIEIFDKNQIPLSVVISNYERCLFNKTIKIKNKVNNENKVSRI